MKSVAHHFATDSAASWDQRDRDRVRIEKAFNSSIRFRDHHVRHLPNLRGDCDRCKIVLESYYIYFEKNWSIHEREKGSIDDSLNQVRIIQET